MTIRSQRTRRTCLPAGRGVLSLVVVSALLATMIPSAFALEGIGPSITVTGTVATITITAQQDWDEYGGELTLTATNGQGVTVVFTKDTQIIAEGRLSRKPLLPKDIMKGMSVRVRGRRLDSGSLTASLFIIQNVSLNPQLSANGTLTAIDGSTISVLQADGKTHVYSLTNETEVNISYTIRGATGLSLIGKKVLLTLNPSNNTQVRVLRISGTEDVNRTKPTTVDFGRRQSGD